MPKGDQFGIFRRDVLAQAAFDILNAAYRDMYGNNLRLERVRLYETPNNWADCVRTS